MKESIIVLGVHRSGTSVLAGLISILGAYPGSDLMKPTEDNPKGYFENNRIVVLNERILADNNASWDDPSFTVDSIPKSKLREYVDAAKLILEDELKYVKKIIIKDPRICILFPVWEQALKELSVKIKVIFIFRSPLEVAQSLKNRKNDSLAVEHGLMLWAHLFLQSEYYSRSYDPLFLEYDDDFQNLDDVLKKIQSFIGGELNKSKIKNAKVFYSPKLKHHKIPFENISDDLPPYLIKLINVLSEKNIKDKRRQLNNIRNEYLRVAKLFLHDWSNNKQTKKEKKNLEKRLKQNEEDYRLEKATFEKQLTQFKTNIEKINKEKQLLNDSLVAVKDELDSAKQKLDSVKQELDSAKQELDSAKQELDSAKEENERELEETRRESVVQLNASLRSADSIFQSLFTDKTKYKQFSKHINKSRKRRLFSLFSNKETEQLLKEKKIIEQSGLFSPVYYLTTYPDIWDAGVDPLLHFCRRGWKEGRQPNADFDLESYVENNPEIMRKNINPLLHFINNGHVGENTVLKNKKTSLFKKLRGVKKENTYIYYPPEYTSEIKNEISCFVNKPLMSVIIPVYNVEKKWLEKAILSVENQWYENWEINIADDASTNKEMLDYLKSLKHPKINIKFLEENGNISRASNEALSMAKGEYIVLMDHDDEITPDALYEVVKVINEKGAEFIYSDEDKLEMDGHFCDPHFKPDFAPDMFLSQNYLSHLGVIKKTLVDKVGGFSVGLEGAQDYDLYLKVLEHTNRIVHIPKVLYHWRMIPGSTAVQFDDKSYAQEAGRKSLQNALERRNIVATVGDGIDPGTYRVKYEIKNNPLVSIIIPFKDMPELLQMCINSVLDKSTYQNYEIIGISNNSEEKDTFLMMEKLQEVDQRIHFYEYNEEFNYSAINNYAVSQYAKGKHVLLLNNDIEIISPGWIEELLMFSQRDDIGVVGAKLYYPNDTIQHAGVIIGIGGVAGHSHKHFPRNSHGYFSRLNIAQNLSAVTAACLMVKKNIYKEVGGLNEKELKVAFNDVDFCLRVREKGYLNVFTPYCEAYHHESISRGAEDNPEKKTRFNLECDYMKMRHENILSDGDVYYNKNLTLKHENFTLAFE